MKASRPLYVIAGDIKKEWKNVNFAAKPYLNAMGCLKSVEDWYYADSGDMVVRYFLSNASAFRGDRAKELKNELKQMIK